MIVITGASGSLGRAVAAAATTAPDLGPVRLVSRRPESLAEHAGRAERAQADFDDPASLETAFDGAGAVVLISTDAPDEVRRHQHAAAVARAGVRHVVHTSFVTAGQHPDMPHGQLHRETEQALATAVPSSTVLRNSVYADSCLLLAPLALRTGRLALPAGDGAVAFVARADIARDVVAALRTPPAGQRTVTLTGPSAHGCREVAAAITAASGRPVRYDDVDPADSVRWLAPLGLPPAVAGMIVGAAQVWRTGAFAGPTRDFPALVGHEAEAAPATWRRLLAGAAPGP